MSEETEDPFAKVFTGEAAQHSSRPEKRYQAVVASLRPIRFDV